jgi:hypothetical protein
VVALAALLLFITLAPRPAAGVGAGLAVAAAALGAFAGWTLLSSTWSDAPFRTTLEFQRVLLFWVVLCLFGAAGAAGVTARAMVRALALASGLLVVAALCVWCLPEVFPADGFRRDRLTWPTSYWNATGLLAAFAALWALHLSASPHERRVVRLLGAGAVPAAVAAVEFSASRGAVAALALGLVVVVSATRTAGMVAAVVTAGVASLAATLVVRGTSGLATGDVGADGVASGQRALVLLGLCSLLAVAVRVALLRLEPALRRAGPRVAPRRPRVAGAAALVLVAAAALALGAPARLGDAWEEFSDPAPVEAGDAPLDRLTRIGNNGRIDHWRVALRDGFSAEPVRGVGAGGFQTLWDRHRPRYFPVADAHSLPLEVLAELGAVGLLLLGVALLACLAGLARRARGPDGDAWAVLLACGVALLFHAAADWDWEMPATFVWFFAAGGLALAHRPADPARGTLGPTPRVLLALGCVGLALLPVAVWRSQQLVTDAVGAFRAGDCARTVQAALDGADVISARSEPLELIAYCQFRRGDRRQALVSIDAAIRRDARAWDLRYARALLIAASGTGDPRPALREALDRNPREPVLRDAARAFASRDRRAWQAFARKAPLPLPAETCDRPSCGGSRRLRVVSRSPRARWPTSPPPRRRTRRPASCRSSSTDRRRASRRRPGGGSRAGSRPRRTRSGSSRRRRRRRPRRSRRTAGWAWPRWGRAPRRRRARARAGG